MEQTMPASRLTVNSYISMGLAVSFIIGVTWILTAINSVDKSATNNFNGIKDTMSEKLISEEKSITQQIQSVKDDNHELKNTFTTLQHDFLEFKSAYKASDRWTTTDMFRWAVKLQQANTNKIVVPEPTKSNFGQGE